MVAQPVKGQYCPYIHNVYSMMCVGLYSGYIVYNTVVSLHRCPERGSSWSGKGCRERAGWADSQTNRRPH